MPTFRQEIQEFIDEITGASHEGEPIEERIHHIVREGVDVVGKALASLDKSNPVAVAELVSEIEAAAVVLADKLLAGRVVVLRIVKTAIPWVVAPAVDALAEFGGPVQDFVDQHVLPRLFRWEETIHRTRAALGG